MRYAFEHEILSSEVDSHVGIVLYLHVKGGVTFLAPLTKCTRINL